MRISSINYKITPFFPERFTAILEALEFFKSDRKLNLFCRYFREKSISFQMFLKVLSNEKTNVTENKTSSETKTIFEIVHTIIS